MKLRLSARKSHLARLQAFSVGAALEKAHTNLEIEYLFKESLGDQNQNDPLWKLPSQGVFTEDFVQDLLENKTDLVVHSWKDLPTAPRPNLAIFGTLPREDARDLFLLRKKSLGRSQLTLLTSSPRRTFSAESWLKDLLPFPIESLETKPVRGNILTRLKKLVQGEGDALFMAKAALDRMLSAPQEEFKEAQKEIRAYLEEVHWMVLPLSLFPTAPAQGALAIEGLSTREDLRKLLAPIHCAKTFRVVEKERKTFSSFGGGCHQKIGLTVQTHERLGEVEFFYGTLPDGSIRHSLKAAKSPPPPSQKKWPLEPTSLFHRIPLPVEHPGTDLYIARAEALPKNWVLQEELHWCGGIETWKKLAARGVWVHGSDEGLGENLPAVQALMNRPLQWTKLTHAASENKEQFPLLPTYLLEPKGQLPPQVESYFWMSASSFSWVLAEQPALKQARHACGPGHTAKTLERILGKPVEVYINYHHWRNGDPLGKK